MSTLHKICANVSQTKSQPREGSGHEVSLLAKELLATVSSWKWRVNAKSIDPDKKTMLQ